MIMTTGEKMMHVRNTPKLVKKSNNNIIMKTFIIFLNFLLITLILYNIFSSNIIEGLSGCSPNQKSAVYKQQALIDRLFSETNELKAEYKQLKGVAATNTIKIGANSGNMRKTTAKVDEGRKEKERELDSIEKENPTDPVIPLQPMPTQSRSANSFGANMKGSASIA